MRRTRPPTPRGSTLIELMISLAVLAVGMLAMWHLHVVGLTSTAAGRRHTVATALAQELLSGLERLPFDDVAGHLSSNYVGQGTASGPPSTALFGALVDGSGNVRLTGGLVPVHEWSDSTPIPGVRLDAQLRDTSGGYQRRWTVWGLLSPQPGAAGTTPGAKVIAVSVVWNDPPFARPREVVLFSQIPNPGSIVAGMAASP